MFRRMWRVTVCAAILLSAAPQLTTASVVNNGYFETGSFSGWTLSNKAAVATRGSLFEPIQGDYSAVIINYSTAGYVLGGSCAGDPWNAICPPPLPYAPQGGPKLTYTQFYAPDVGSYIDVGWSFIRGSFIGQDIQVKSGDVLSWQWQMFGLDVGIDSARFVALNESTVFSPALYIDYKSAVTTYTFDRDGLWTIYFGTYQTEDPYYSTSLVLDNIQVNKVSEPGVLAIFSLGLASILLLLRRHSVTKPVKGFAAFAQ